MEAHFNSKHKKLYAEWRCQDAAATKPSQEDTADDDAIDSTDSTDEPALPDISSIKRPLTGVWAPPPPSYSQGAVSSGSAGMVMPSPAAVASSAQAPEPKSWRRSSPFNVFTDQQTNELEKIGDVENICVDSSLWQWMVSYAQFQHSAQLLNDAPPNSEIETYFENCNRTLKDMVSIAPLKDLYYCQTSKGAHWPAVVGSFETYFETQNAAKLTLTGSPIKFSALMPDMSQLVKQVLTWKLTNG